MHRYLIGGLVAMVMLGVAYAQGVTGIAGLYDLTPPTCADGFNCQIQTDSAGLLKNVFPALPTGATAITGSSGNVAASSAVATLAAAASKTTYITGFQCTGAGATAASNVIIAITGTITGTMSYIVSPQAGATVNLDPRIVAFPVPVPASAVNTAIVVTMPTLGAGNTHAACSAQGFQL